MQQLTRPITKKLQRTNTLWEFTVGLESNDTFVSSLQPGQFFLLNSFTPYLAYLQRPIFPSGATNLTDNETETDSSLGVQFLIPYSRLNDPAISWLISRQVGEQINILGPFGQGFTISTYGSRLLLLANETEIGPLIFLLKKAIQQGRDVVLGLEASRTDGLYPAHLIPPAAEIHLMTHDGQFGHGASILDSVNHLLDWADTLCAVGTLPFYQKLHSHIDETKLHLVEKFANVLIKSPNLHICGAGICTYCTIPTKNGLRLNCQDGPVFDLAQLDLEAIS